MNELKDIVVIYHDHCYDGFGAAWAAWRKYKDSASYIPAGYGDLLPDGIEGKEVYVLDFSYNPETLEKLEKIAKKLVVIDHHKGAEEHVKKTKEHVFSLDNSGAYLAWEYFHKDEKVPDFIKYLSEGDIFQLKSANIEEILAYIQAQKQTFPDFERLYMEFEDQEKRHLIIEKGLLLLGYRDIVLETSLHGVHFIEIGGFILPAINTSLPMSEKSYLLHNVYEMYPPVALAYRFNGEEWRCSVRSKKEEFNCLDLVQQFGGSGHKGSAGFSIKGEEGKFPFKIVPMPEKFLLN